MRKVVVIVLVLLLPFSLLSQTDIKKDVDNKPASDTLLQSAESDTLVLDDKLGSEYNLGRIPSEYLFDNTMGWDQFGKHGLLLETFRSRSGRTGYFSVGYIPAILVAGPGDNLFYGQLLPEIDFSWKTKSSHKLFLSCSPLNFSFVSEGPYSGSGFDMPFTTLQNFQWNFLSKEGTIHLSPENYDLSFLLGPQLNPGQIRNDVNIVHTLNADTVPLRLFNISLFPSVGLIDGLQLNGSAGYSFVDSVTDTWYSNNAKVYEKMVRDSTHIGLGLQYRKGLFFADGKYSSDWSHYKQQPSEFAGGGTYINNSLENHQITLNTGYLLGKRIEEINAVRGNWDGFYSQWLGKNQLFTTLGAEVVPTRILSNLTTGTSGNAVQPIDAMEHKKRSIVNVQQNLRYGISQYFEIAEQFKAYTGTASAPWYRLGLKLSTNTLPLRTYGPDSASNDEYFHGIILKKSQVFASISYFMSFLKPRDDYQYSPVFERVKSYGSISSITDPLGRQNMIQALDISQQTNTSMLRDADFSLHFSWGITDNVALSNYFDFGSLKFKKPDQGQSMYDPSPLATYNNLISNLSMVSFHVGRSIRLIFAVDYISQSDDNAGYAKEYKDNVTVLFLIQAAMRSNLAGIQMQKKNDGSLY